MIWILFIGTMALSLWAMWRVKSVYNRYNQGVVRSGLTGGQAAAEILRLTGIRDVEITHAEGMLGDHYDPIHKRLVLSEDELLWPHPGRARRGGARMRSRHPARAGLRAVALAHGGGGHHHLRKLRRHVPAVARALHRLDHAVDGRVFMAVAWGIIMLFNLVTLPVEFDASRRAKVVLADFNFIAPGEEATGVKRVLDAAAWTYVAAFITSLAYFLWHLLPLLTGEGSANNRHSNSR